MTAAPSASNESCKVRAQEAGGPRYQNTIPFVLRHRNNPPEQV